MGGSFKMAILVPRSHALPMTSRNFRSHVTGLAPKYENIEKITKHYGTTHRSPGTCTKYIVTASLYIPALIAYFTTIEDPREHSKLAKVTCYGR